MTMELLKNGLCLYNTTYVYIIINHAIRLNGFVIIIKTFK